MNKHDHHHHDHSHNHSHDCGHDHDHGHDHSILDELNHQHGTEIVLEGELNINVEKVWEILTANHYLQQWFPELEFTDLKAGGNLHFEAESMDLLLEMMVYDVEPPTLLSFEWGEGDIVTFELKAVDDNMTRMLYSQWIHHIDLEHHAKDITGWLICMQKIAAIVNQEEIPDSLQLYNEYYHSVLELVKDQSQAEFN